MDDKMGSIKALSHPRAGRCAAGTGRLEDLAERFSGMPAQQITNAVANDVRAFCAEHEQNDDLTILAARWLGPAGGAPTEHPLNHHAT